MVIAFFHRTTGRPRVFLDMDEVELLRHLQFPWSKIAVVLGVCRSTLYRRLEEEGISRESFYSDISDNQLDKK